MPLYDYKCPTCNKEEEAYETVANRNLHLCSCGLPMDIQLGAVTDASYPEPGWNWGLGKYVWSWRDLREKCKQRGEELGTTITPHATIPR